MDQPIQWQLTSGVHYKDTWFPNLKKAYVILEEDLFLFSKKKYFDFCGAECNKVNSKSIYRTNFRTVEKVPHGYLKKWKTARQSLRFLPWYLMIKHLLKQFVTSTLVQVLVSY